MGLNNKLYSIKIIIMEVPVTLTEQEIYYPHRLPKECFSMKPEEYPVPSVIKANYTTMVLMAYKLP